MPKRGAIAVALFRSYQRSAFRNTRALDTGAPLRVICQIRRRKITTQLQPKATRRDRARGPPRRVNPVWIRTQRVFPHVREAVIVRISRIPGDGWITRVRPEIRRLPNVLRRDPQPENRNPVLSARINFSVRYSRHGKLDAIGMAVAISGGLRAVINFAGQICRIKRSKHPRSAVLQCP